MANPFHDFDWSLKSIGKILGFLIIGVISLSIVAAILSFSVRTITSPFTGNSVSFEQADSFRRGGAISTKGILLPVSGVGGVVGRDAENFEVQSYFASYRTNDKTKICGRVFELKADLEIIFESANESDRSCNYRFEVPNEQADEVLQILEDLKPEDISKSVYTIQRAVEGVEDRLEVLKKRLQQTEETLLEAQTSYDELTTLAKNRGDVESLTKLIDLKINTIERLAREKLNINEEIEQVQRSRLDLLRQIAYTEFSVNVREERFVDWQQIANDWKQEIRNLVSNINQLTQFVSVKLISFVLYSAASLLYLAIAFGFLKLVWVIGKKVWKLGNR